MKYYKIHKKGTDLYSTGGMTPDWSKKGKVWTNIGHLKNHLHGLMNGAVDYRDAEIIELEMTPVGIPRSVQDMLQELQEEKDRQRREQEAVWAKQREDHEKEQLRLLRAKYPEA